MTLRTSSDTIESSQHDGAELQDLVERFLAATSRRNGTRLIGAKSPETLFRPSELVILEEEVRRARRQDVLGPQTQATVVIKATRLCNLRCSYCNSWGVGPGNVISFRAVLRRTLEALFGVASESIDFVWHGGEMTMLSPAFVEKMIWVQERYRPPRLRIANSLQTNGVEIAERWLDFLERAPIGVGVSIDGPRAIHDRNRRSADGAGSYDRVVANLRRLKLRGIPYGALIVVGRATLDMPIADYLDWLVENDIRHLDFLNVAPCDDDMNAGVPDPDFVPVDEFVRWLVAVDEHIEKEERWQRIRIRFVEDVTAAVKESRRPIGCYFSGTCHSNVLTINPSGSVSPCDKYVTNPTPELTRPFNTGLARTAIELGALRESLGSDQWIARDKCRWRSLCNGACPHDSQTLSMRDGGSLQACCGFGPLFDRAEAKLRPGGCGQSAIDARTKDN